MRSRIMKTVGSAVALAACIGMTTFAAPSPTAKPVDNTATSTTTSPKTDASNVSTVAVVGLGAAVAACGLKKRTVVE